MATDYNILSLDDLACEIGGRQLFAGLGVSLTSGSLLVIKGENGCGKSTLLSTLAGLQKPAAGRVLYNHISIAEHDSYVRESVFISHRTCLNPELTVLENMQYQAQLFGEPSLIETAIHYFDLAPFIDMRAGDLSQGWQQRVSLARLLYMPANVWLSDEPTSHLDDAGVSLFNSLVMSRMEQGGIVVMSTHAQIFTKEIKVLYINDYIA